MSYCLNPQCQKPQNPDGTKFCQSCGEKLLLTDRYRATVPLGQGGFARTFKAVDQYRLNHPCVIKQFLRPPEQNQKATELFNQEAVRLYELGKHPQIPELYAHFEVDNRLYLVQEFIDGQNLADELQQGTKSESEIRELLVDLLTVLKFIHEKGVIHRDIKPENIIRCRTLTPNPSPIKGEGSKMGGQLVLIDFGGAKQLVANAPVKTGTMLVTPGYAPLEQRYGKACQQSDLYALGVTCIRLMTGILPLINLYGELNDDLFDPLEGAWVWRERLPQSTSVSQELGEILDKLLKYLVKDRYQSVDEVLLALNQPKVATTIINPRPTPDPAAVYNPPPPVAAVPLESERGIDYTKLCDLLAAKKWQEADGETGKKMLEVMGRQQRGYLDTEDIEKFPCKDLRTINQLWVHYSNGRFGLSVQKRIWIELGGEPGVYNNDVWDRFGDRVGWRRENEWKSYSALTFTSNSPLGHLPAETFAAGRPLVVAPGRGFLGFGSFTFVCLGRSCLQSLLSRRDL